MNLFEEVKSKGWFLKEQFVENYSNCSEIISTALNMDFREIGTGALSAKREETIPGRIVLQIMKIRNIAAPKAREDSKQVPRFLLIDLTDGHITIQALDLGFLSVIDLKTLPGTKVYFRSERLRLMQGFLILHSNEIDVLGGRVPSLVEKWEFSQSMKQCTLMGRRTNSATGPPLWIAFDKKKSYTNEILSNEKSFKSIKLVTSKDDKVNEEFTTMRSEAIDNANKIGLKKVFGGGNQKILDYNIKNITAKGFTEHEAKEALRITNNNLERALYSLKRGPIDSTSDKQKKFQSKNYNKQLFDDEMPKASSNGTITLYDFLKCETTNKIEQHATEQTYRPNILSDSKHNERQDDIKEYKNQQIKTKVYGQRQSNIDGTKSSLVKNEGAQRNHENMFVQQNRKRTQKQHEKNRPDNSTTLIENNSYSIQQTTSISSSRNQKIPSVFYDSSKIVGFQHKKVQDSSVITVKNEIQSTLDTSRLMSHDSIKNPLPTNATNQKVNYRNATESVRTKSDVESCSWQWKIGDFCIAKYWDDGQYYDAQITAISENTCVVLFLNYGNHEEVLKTDCLPVADKSRNSEKRTNYSRGPRRFRRIRQKDEN